MKQSVLCCALSILLLLPFSGCTQGKGPAVSDKVLQAFLLREEAAVDLLEISDAAKEEGGNHFYHKTLSWCGIKMDTEFIFKKEKAYCVTAEKVYDDTEKTRALAEECLKLFKEQLGSPHSCAFLRNNVDTVFGETYTEDENGAAIEQEGFDTIFSEEPVIGRPLEFKFVFPGTDGAEDRIYLVCSYYRAKETPEQVTFSFQILANIMDPEFSK